MTEKAKLKFVQVSDLHITNYSNLLAPMVPSINREDVDFVIVTGDLVSKPTEENYAIAVKTLNSINAKVIVLPGECDGTGLFEQHFGNRYKSTMINGYCIDTLDTSAMGESYAIGWCDWMRIEDRLQHTWYLNQLSAFPDNYHFVFSHHPTFGQLHKVENPINDYLQNNVRAIYSGHAHDTYTNTFNYSKPMRKFSNGFTSVPMKFHGNSVYMFVMVKETDDIVHVPRIVNTKKTAW